MKKKAGNNLACEVLPELVVLKRVAVVQARLSSEVLSVDIAPRPQAHLCDALVAILPGNKISKNGGVRLFMDALVPCIHS